MQEIQLYGGQDETAAGGGQRIHSRRGCAE